MLLFVEAGGLFGETLNDGASADQRPLSGLGGGGGGGGVGQTGKASQYLIFEITGL